METASENTQAKAQRGRPKRFSDAEMAIYRWVASEVKTTRHLVNIGYQQRAVGLLYEDAQFCWLCDKERMQAGAAKAWRRGIFSELGRIDDPDELRTVAEQICKMQPKTNAVALIRRWRLGKEAKGGWVSLAVRLEQTVNEFKQTNPCLSWKDIAQALETVLEAVREKEAVEQRSTRCKEASPACHRCPGNTSQEERDSFVEGVVSHPSS